MQTLDEIISLHARTRADAPAIISARTRLTYAELDELVARAAPPPDQVPLGQYIRVLSIDITAFSA